MTQEPVKHILLGITGGIAAYKSAELLRLLMKHGVEVQVAMTAAACHFITPTTLQGLSGKPVFTDQWDDGSTNGMAHINLSRSVDAVVVAPATADFIARLANGLADDLLATLCLARNCPLLVAPAMNREMWQNAATQRNVAQLSADGVQILGPECGLQACGENGMGRMLEAQHLTQLILEFLHTDGRARHNTIGTTKNTHGTQAGCTHMALQDAQPGRFNGRKILITAGPTYEAIDAVRGITNRSSGKMGYAIAKAAREQGAKVLLISGPTALSKPSGVEVVDVTSAAQMFDAVQQHLNSCDIFISVAAIADYRVAHPSEQKIKKGTVALTLELIPNPDILAYVAGLDHPPYCVGFAAESENLVEYAEQKRRAKKLPLLVGNLVQHAIGSDHSELMLFDDNGSIVLPRADKLTLARLLMQHIAERYEGAIK